MTGSQTIIVEFPGNDQFLADQAYLASDSKKDIKLNEDKLKESKKLWNPGFVTSLILDEIKINPFDKITVICKGGDEIDISTVLLASISPYLATLFKNVTSKHESKEMVLILPDVEKSAIAQIVNIALKDRNSAATNSVKTFGVLDGVFWNFKGYNQEEKKDELKDLDISDPSTIVTVNYPKINTQDIFSESFKSQYNVSNSKSASTRKRKLSINDALEDFAGDTSMNVVEKRLKPSTNVIPTDDLINNSVNDFEDIDIPDFSDDIQSDNDKDFELDNFDNNESNPKKVKHKDKLILDPESEEFSNAQQKLKEALEDENNLEDPFHLWFIYHDLNPRIISLRKQKKIVKYVCPLCNYKSYNGQRHKFAAHLREHKYLKFKCKCESSKIRNEHELENDNTSKKTEEHIKLNHWGLTRCRYYNKNKCRAILDEYYYPMHLFEMHKEKDALNCSKCQKVYTSSKYFTHMDVFHSNELNDNICDCKDIVFHSSTHRKHHMQVVHKKEKMGCNKCYFLCTTQEEMDEHIISCIYHKRLKKNAICDECGGVFRNEKCLDNHKMNIHDPILIQCKMCPVKLSAHGLKMHMLNVHADGFCNICEVQVKSLKRHMYDNHSIKNGHFKCEHCPNKVFKAKHHLSRHIMSIHLKEKPFNCRFGCDLAYSDACNRNAHERRVHGRLYEVKRNRFSYLNNKCSRDSYKSSRATEVKCATNNSDTE